MAGFNVKTNYPCPLFHKNLKRVLLIGVTNFIPKSKTSRYFGWFRAGISVLIKIVENADEKAYIDINNQRHVWKTECSFFILDDTVLHQSFNLGEKSRNCLFIDVTRPSLISFFINSMVKTFGLITTQIPTFRKLSKWEVVK